MAIKKGTWDVLLSGRDPKAVFSNDGLFDELKKALARARLERGTGRSSGWPGGGIGLSSHITQ